MSNALPRPRSRRRWLKWTSVLFSVLVVAVCLAPSALTRTGLGLVLVRKCLPPTVGDVRIGALRFGWFTPLNVDRLEVQDAQGAPLLEVAGITGDRTLLQLVAKRTELGRIVVAQPRVFAALRADGSSLEDVVAPWLDAPASPSAESTSALALSIDIRDGAIEATEQESGSVWTVSELAAELDMPAEARELWRIAVTGKMDGQTFSLDVTAPFGEAAAGSPLGPHGQLQAAADALPIEPLQYLARRGGASLGMEGSWTADVAAKWESQGDTPSPRLQARTSLSVANLNLAAPELLGAETVRIEAATCQSNIVVEDGLARLEAFHLASDVGVVDASAAARLDDLGGDDLSDTLRRILLSQRCATAGYIDIAAVARTAPQLLRIREDSQLRSGQLTWDLSAGPAEDSTVRCEGRLGTRDLQLTRDGQIVDWRLPLEAEVVARVGDQWELEKLAVESDFLTAHARGNLQGGRLDLQADLDALLRQISQLVDVQDLRLKGRVAAGLQWQEVATNRLGAEARVQLTDLELARGDRILLQEPELTVDAAGAATLAGQTIQSVESARCDLASGSDRIHAELTQAVNAPQGNTMWPLTADFQSELSPWVARLRLMDVAQDWVLQGALTGRADATVGLKRSELHQLSGEVRDLVAALSGIHVRESVVRFTGSGTFAHDEVECQVASATLVSQSFSAAARDLRLRTSPHFSLTGDVGYRADLARLNENLSAAGQPAQSWVWGELVGQARMEAAAESTAFRVSGTVEDLRVEQAANRPAAQLRHVGLAPSRAALPPSTAALWQEPKITFRVEGQYDARSDQLELQEGEIAAASLRLAGVGRVAQLTTLPELDVRGQLDYDLAELLTRVGDFLGADVRLTGHGPQPVSLQGPLWPESSPAGELQATRISPRLVGRAGLAWESAQLYEVPLGPADVELNLSQGLLQAAPLTLAVGAGRVHLSPTVYVNSPLLWMTLPPGVVAEELRITPEMCKTWLRFVAPLLADATAVEGNFSLSMAQAEVPLLNPLEGRLTGELAIHGGAVGPGPLAQQLLSVVGQIKQLVDRGNSRVADPTRSWVVLQPQQISFRLAERRVFHDGFTMLVDDVPIRTRGSVGLDETVSLVAEVPVMDAWIDRQPALAGLRGQTISLPIGGTVSQPRLDERALRELSEQLVRRAAEGYLQQEVGNQIEKQLNRLFK